MKEIINFLRILWELPQCLLGFILFQVYSMDCMCMEVPYGDVRILYSERMRGGISLGRFIILPWKYRYNSSSYVRDTISHEYGTQGHRYTSAGSTSALYWPLNTSPSPRDRPPTRLPASA